MDEHNLLYSVIQLFTGIDLSIQRVSNIQMGYIFEEFIRRFLRMPRRAIIIHRAKLFN